MKFTWAAKDFCLEFWCGRAIAFVIFTRWIGFGMSVHFPRIDFGGVMSWNTQPNCRASDDWRLKWILSKFLINPLPRFPRSIVTLVGNRFSFLPITFLPIWPLHFCHHFLDLFVGCSSTWRCANEHFSPKQTTTLGLVEQAFWKVPFFTKWVIASSSKVILARPSRRSTAGAPASGTSGSRWFSLKNSETDLMV